ncbi:hypothetical protein GQ53DRAFT_743379 [Thozetella sp. PMI_491]|nr:hypothetical protein GQ53DRAFT_743379 [Thozetella sp. PMI_491]
MGERIWDSTGKGCIVTGEGCHSRTIPIECLVIAKSSGLLDAPVTQIQCDLDKEPAAGFSIDSSEVISYKGSSQFYACPATDTEYNIYVDPNFGQAKCFPVTLTASGCRAAPLPTSCPTNQPASTVWETCTVTEVATQTLTVTLTSTESCQAPSPTSWYNATTSKGCHKCTAGTGDSGWTTYTTKVL